MLFTPALIFPSGVTYTGPGDVVSGASSWWGLRAYSAAEIGTNAIRIVRASDSTQQNFITLASGSLDVASIATFLAATTGNVVTLYDQTGNGVDLAPSSAPPAVTLSGLGSLPVLTFTFGGSGALSATTSATADLWTIAGAAKRTGHSSNYQRLLTDTSSVGLLFDTVADSVLLNGASSLTVAGTDNNWHAMQGINAGSGNTSTLKVDSASSTGNLGSSALGTLRNIALDGQFAEVGLWPSAFSAGNITAMNTNIHNYWGF